MAVAAIAVGNTGLDISRLLDAGPPELSREEEWLKLQGHPDVLATAPNDEVLAELLALQVIS